MNFRLISDTRQDLEQYIATGKFREDFYYRINVIQIPVPPLRFRRDDIPLLITHFLEKYSHETSKQVDHVSKNTVEQLTRIWSGTIDCLSAKGVASEQLVNGSLLTPSCGAGSLSSEVAVAVFDMLADLRDRLRD